MSSSEDHFWRRAHKKHEKKCDKRWSLLYPRLESLECELAVLKTRQGALLGVSSVIATGVVATLGMLIVKLV